MASWRVRLARVFGRHVTYLRSADDLSERLVWFGYRGGYKQPYIKYLGKRVWILPDGRVIGPDYCYEHYPVNFALPHGRVRNRHAAWKDCKVCNPEIATGFPSTKPGECAVCEEIAALKKELRHG